MKERLLRLKLLGLLTGLGLLALAAWLVWSWIAGLPQDTLAAWILIETLIGIPLVSSITYFLGRSESRGFVEGQKTKIQTASSILKNGPLPNIDLSNGPAPRVEKQEQKTGFTEL
jgi:hypothetical protein